MEFLQYAWQKAQTLFDLAFAGALGAMISLRFHTEILTFSQRAVLVGSGCVAAHYVSPLVIIFFELSHEKGTSIAFLIGLFGMSLAAAIMKAIKHTDIVGVVHGWLNRPR